MVYFGAQGKLSVPGTTLEEARLVLQANVFVGDDLELLIIGETFSLAREIRKVIEVSWALLVDTILHCGEQL